MSWIGLAMLVVGCGSGSGTATTAVTAQTQTPTATATSSGTPTPSPTATISLAEWRDKHGSNITIVIATAHGLVNAIDKANETQIAKSCDALKNNYRTFLQPIPDPPGTLGKTGGTWDTALDNIYNAQRNCSGGLIRSSDLHEAQIEAATGVTLLNEVLGTGS